MRRRNRHVKRAKKQALALPIGRLLYFYSLSSLRFHQYPSPSTLTIANISEFPVRGQPDHDRQYRRPRTRADKTAKRDPNKVRRDVSDAPIARQSSTAPAWLDIDEWDLLPPLPEVVDAVCLFTRKYFQLGFIPKELFPQRLRQNHRSVSVFLLLSILSISARFSPALAKRYEGEISAAHYFMEHASNLALRELYREPTLERCQAFYLLSIAQQGSGHRNRSYVSMSRCVISPSHGK